MIEVLKQLVDALENHSAIKHPQQIHYRDEAVQSGKQAIAELESQEPVALPCCGYKDANAVKWNPLNGVVQCHNCGQNYTTSRTWVDLTRTQIQDVYFEVLKEHRGGHQIQGQIAFGEALQAKLKERNT